VGFLMGGRWKGEGKKWVGGGGRRGRGLGGGGVPTPAAECGGPEWGGQTAKRQRWETTLPQVSQAALSAECKKESGCC